MIKSIAIVIVLSEYDVCFEVTKVVHNDSVRSKSDCITIFSCFILNTEAYGNRLHLSLMILHKGLCDQLSALIVGGLAVPTSDLGNVTSQRTHLKFGLQPQRLIFAK